MSVQIGWKVDTNACISCRSCEMACKVEYDLKAGQGRRRRVIEKTLLETSLDTGSNTVRTFFLSLACNHCEKPACIEACPKSPHKVTDSNYTTKTALELQETNALWKDIAGSSLSKGVKGVVRVNPDLCVGCRRCEWACPYGAPQYNPTTLEIHKCEMCFERIGSTTLHPSRRVGACVATCLGQAIKQDWVDTDPAVSYSHTRKDTDGYTESTTTASRPTYGTSDRGLLSTTLDTAAPGNPKGGSQTYPTATGSFVAPGTAGRGSAYVADAYMTRPALKIKNRVYVTRSGGVE